MAMLAMKQKAAFLVPGSEFKLTRASFENITLLQTLKCVQGNACGLDVDTLREVIKGHEIFLLSSHL